MLARIDELNVELIFREYLILTEFEQLRDGLTMHYRRNPAIQSRGNPVDFSIDGVRIGPALRWRPISGMPEGLLPRSIETAVKRRKTMTSFGSD